MLHAIENGLIPFIEASASVTTIRRQSADNRHCYPIPFSRQSHDFQRATEVCCLNIVHALLVSLNFISVSVVSAPPARVRVPRPASPEKE
jgi:hypothetical protein